MNIEDESLSNHSQADADREQSICDLSRFQGEY